MNKEQLLSNVKNWIAIDDDIKELSRALKEKRAEKKVQLIIIILLSCLSEKKPIGN